MLNHNERVSQNSLISNPMLQKQYFKSENGNEMPVNPNDSSEKLSAALSKVKVELINNKKNILIEKIKKTVIELVYYSEKQIKTNFSDYLSEKLGYHYTYMANLFAKVHGSSIQSFIIATKIERVKELLIYEGMTLTEISFKLHYSSVAHLSNQFKKVMGMNPSQFLASVAKNEVLVLNKSNDENLYSQADEESKDRSNVLTMVNPQTMPEQAPVYKQMKG